MSAPTGVVLLATAVVSSPLLWLVHEQTISLEDAAERGLVCLVVCRIAISIVSALAYPTPRPQATPSAETDRGPTSASGDKSSGTTRPADGPKDALTG